MTYLRRVAPKIAFDPIMHPEHGRFPFSVPTIKSLSALTFSTAVTFFVGENGSGKSTLLEAIALQADLFAFGGNALASDTSLTQQRALASALRLSWEQRNRRGFFMRAEDLHGYAKRMAYDDARIAREMREVATKTRTAPQDPSEVHMDEREAAKYLGAYDSRSHGESFLDLFSERVRAPGIYLLDEPEGPLSPRRQFALLSLIIERAREGAQFIVATHSPILTACPDATIYAFADGAISETSYAELDQVNFLRDFLSDPFRFTRSV